MIRDSIQNTPEYQTANDPQRQTTGASVGTVVSFEKSDIEFITDVLTVVLLYLIWRELQRGV